MNLMAKKFEDGYAATCFVALFRYAMCFLTAILHESNSLQDKCLQFCTLGTIFAVPQLYLKNTKFFTIFLYSSIFLFKLSRQNT